MRFPSLSRNLSKRLGCICKITCYAERAGLTRWHEECTRTALCLLGQNAQSLEKEGAGLLTSAVEELPPVATKFMPHKIGESFAQLYAARAGKEPRRRGFRIGTTPQEVVQQQHVCSMNPLPKIFRRFPPLEGCPEPRPDHVNMFSCARNSQHLPEQGPRRCAVAPHSLTRHGKIDLFLNVPAQHQSTKHANS